ncbi:uncharacterized protein LOC126970871 [Leptidea sinapis]|uniref:uncharacterized protein LOC126970871 n=1 Tax=Leptidea sinapis TaxID=189913 RepID=UPI002145AB93|nr:uncharacterized protein LOC126970871 [Leptidea sinapis]
MCDTETLILAIEKVPCLWNITHEDYHNKDVRDSAWEQVCKEVINNWESHTKTERLNKSADLKRKWTHVRDYYRKEIQKNKSNPSAKKSKKYIYADILHFLFPIFDKRTSERNSESDESDDIVKDVNDREENTKGSKTINSPSAVAPLLSKTSKKRDIIYKIASSHEEKEKRKGVKPKQVFREEDDDTKFLLSFRTYMRRMNVNQTIDFKIGMLQLVKKINMENANCSSPNATNIDYQFSDNTLSSEPSPDYILPHRDRYEKLPQ